MGVCTATGSKFMTHAELIQRGVKWLKGQKGSIRYSCPIIITELVTVATEIPDILGFGSSHSVLIECKVSHSDFSADFKKSHRRQLNGHGLGTYRFYLSPEKLINKSEVPSDWGLLYCHLDNTITIEKEPIAHNYDETRIKEYYVLYSLLRRNIKLITL